MDKEFTYFISLLNAFLNQEKAELDSDINYHQLYKISNSHNLSAIVFCVLNTSCNKEVVPSDAFKRFEDDFFEAVIRYDMQENVLQEIDSVLRDSHLRHVFFKGAEIKEDYPVPQARVMGDIDVLIDESNRGTVKKVLTENGFSLIHSNGPVYDYKKDGVKIEVHTKIISGKVGNANAEKCFIDAAEHADYQDFRGSLDINYHFAYLITHIAHHFWFYGAGVKLILDLAVLLKQYDIRLDAVLDKLREAGLDEFGKVILSVTNQWFGVGKSYFDNTDKTQEFLLSYGAFGNVNRSKAAVIERKELEEGKKSSAVMTRLRLLFPSYENVKNIPYIKFIEGKPYLLPYAWVYRIAYNLKNRKAYVKHTTKKIGSDETNSYAQKELAYFKEIGLL